MKSVQQVFFFFFFKASIIRKECVNVTSVVVAATPSSIVSLMVLSGSKVSGDTWYFSVVCAFVMGLWLRMLFPVSPQAQTRPVKSSQLFKRIHQRQRR